MYSNKLSSFGIEYAIENIHDCKYNIHVQVVSLLSILDRPPSSLLSCTSTTK